jgi:protein-tyrosine kinase
MNDKDDSIFDDYANGSEPHDAEVDLPANGGELTNGAAVKEQPDRRPRSAPTGRVQLDPRCEELFRGMWASLFYSGRTGGRTIVLTGAGRREGASTIAAGLALSGSGPASAARVALVDFNLRDPAIHEIMKIPQQPGLAELLLNGVEEAREVARPVSANLDVYPVGGIAHRSLELLRSDAVHQFFDALADAYDYVLVDTAAANHFPDAQVLGGVLGDVVMVVNSDITPREAVAQAKKRIEAGGGRVVGVVLNLRTFPIPNFLYRRM